jgi:hypothetical protein
VRAEARDARKSSPCSVAHTMYYGYPRSTGIRAAARTPPVGSRTHSTTRPDGALNSRPASAHVSGVTTAQLYPQQRAGEGQELRTACNTSLSGDGGVQWRPYWFEVNVRDEGMIDGIEGSFAKVRNLCDALHKHLGGLSTSAATVEVFVLGPDGEYVEVAKNRLCSEAIPAGVSLPPRAPGASPLRVTYVPAKRRYWYEANIRGAGMLNLVEGSFAHVRNLCGALHEHLGALSTSAATVEVFVVGPDGEYVAVAKNRLCSEAIPAGASLTPPTPGASPLRVTYVPKAVSWRGPLCRRPPLTSRVIGNPTDTAPDAASPNARPTVPTERPAVLHAINFRADATMDAAIPSAPLATKRRTVSLPPPTEQEIAASALKKCRRAIKMRNTPVGAALSLEAFHDANVLGADNSTRNFCRAVANSFLGVGETVA